MRTYRNNRYPVPVNPNTREPGVVSSIARVLGIGSAFGIGSALGDELGRSVFTDDPSDPYDPVDPFPEDPEPYEPYEPYEPSSENPSGAGTDFPDDDGDLPDGGEDGGFADCGNHMDFESFDVL